MNAIKISNLNKKFGESLVIDDLSFEVPDKCICGFLGPNGAGKTTTFKLLTNLLNKDSGKIEIFGECVTSNKQSKHLRFLQDVPEFYNFMSSYEYLKFICQLNNMTNIDKEIKETLELVGLHDVGNKRIGKFSRGMKQRIGIAASIISKPKILILDEPVSALDPIGRKEIFELLNKLRGKMTILFSTHIIDDIERVSDKIVIIHKGKKVLDGSIDDLKKRYATNVIVLRFDEECDRVKFKKNYKAEYLEDNNDILRFKVESINQQIDVFKVLEKQKINIIGFNILTPTLEEIFIEEVTR